MPRKATLPSTNDLIRNATALIARSRQVVADLKVLMDAFQRGRGEFLSSRGDLQQTLRTTEANLSDATRLSPSKG